MCLNSYMDTCYVADRTQESRAAQRDADFKKGESKIYFPILSTAEESEVKTNLLF